MNTAELTAVNHATLQPIQYVILPSPFQLHLCFKQVSVSARSIVNFGQKSLQPFGKALEMAPQDFFVSLSDSDD